MYKKIICAVSILSVLFCGFFTSFAHTGGTDSNGGHYDHSTGEYHYHHGYPAHQHTNGVCPYDFDDKTGQNSGESVTHNIGTKLEKKEGRREVKYNDIEMNDVIYYCFTTNFTSFVTFPVAIFLARFGKPKEWAWAWLGIGIFVSGAILCNDYPLDINSELLVLAAASEIVMSAVSIPLILKMYKIRAQKGWDKEKHRVSRVSVSDTKQLKKKGTTISEQDYQRAMRIISLSVHSKEIKELAQVMGKTPQETMNYFIGVVRNYNLERYSKKEEGR